MLQTTPVVKHTAEYNKFKLIEGNRDVSNKHVQAVIESFQEHPDLIELRPILVNEDLEVVDGQHRLKAAEALGLEIPYIVAPGLDITTAQIMNALQKQWSLADFCRSYAANGNSHYQKFEKYLEDFTPMRHEVMLRFVTGRSVMESSRGRNDAQVRRDFRLGRFVFPEDTTELDYRLGVVSSFADYNTWWYMAPFTNAMLSVLANTPNYDHQRMLKGYAKIRPERTATSLDELRNLERAYNYNVKMPENVERFF